MDQCTICKREMKLTRKTKKDDNNYCYCYDCHKYFVIKNTVELCDEKLALGGSTFKDDISYESGKNAELKFMEMMENEKIQFRPSNKFENCHLHFDFIIEYPKNKYLKIEVKAMKAKQRGMKPNQKVIYIELKNVNGKNGWIFGKSDYIAFEQKETFLFVSRLEIIALIKKLKNDLPESSQSGQIHTLYTRKNRNDLVAVLHVNDLVEIEDKFYLFKNSEKFRAKICSVGKINKPVSQSIYI